MQTALTLFSLDAFVNQECLYGMLRLLPVELVDVLSDVRWSGFRPAVNTPGISGIISFWCKDGYVANLSIFLPSDSLDLGALAQCKVVEQVFLTAARRAEDLLRTRFGFNIPWSLRKMPIQPARSIPVKPTPSPALSPKPRPVMATGPRARLISMEEE